MKKLLLVLLLIPTLLYSQGKLDKAKKSLSSKNTSSNSNSNSNIKPTTTKTKRSKRKHNTSSYANNSAPSIGGFFLKLGFQATYGLVIGKTDFRTLSPYPYYDSESGDYDGYEGNKYHSLKIGANYLFGNVKGIDVNVNYRFVYFLGIEGSHTHFSEKTNSTNLDVLDVSSLMLNYYRVREKKFTLWWGLGATYVGNKVNNAGFAYNLGMEIYPVQPISLHLSWKQSFINSNSIDAFKGHIKYHLKNYAIYTGYQSHTLGTPQVSGAVVGLDYSF